MPDLIKMVDLEMLHQHMQPEIMQAIGQLITGSDFIDGQAVETFQEQLKAFTGAGHVIGCGNGTDALQLALMALELKPGAEVILPAFNYVSALEVVALLGFTPVLADVCADTFNLDPESVARLITPNTAAVIPVHLFGQCADMDRLMPLARQKGLAVIEDNAQSLGATCSVTGQLAAYGGTLGQLGTTSFFPTKMLGGMGDGGALFTNDSSLARRIAQTARHGQEQKYRFVRVGMNSRLDSLQAAILTVKLRHLDQHIRARQQVARWYTQVLQEEKQVALPLTQHGHTHVYNQFTIRVEPGKRDALRQYLAAQQIPTGLYYQLPLHLQPAYQYLGYRSGDLPQAELICNSVLSLPIHPYISQDQVIYIGEKIRHFFR